MEVVRYMDMAAMDEVKRLLNGLTHKYEALRKLIESIDIDSYEPAQDVSLLPKWWHNNNNYALKKKDSISCVPKIVLYQGVRECRDFVLFCNNESDYHITLWGEGLLFISPHAIMRGSTISFGGGVIFIGENVRHTSRLVLNCRNGGVICLRKDVLIASDVTIMTDDCHTIYTIYDGNRRNPYGGRIFIDEHVWIGLGVIIMGDTTISNNSIIGARSVVRGAFSQSNIVIAGNPARVVAEGTNWDHRDIPPSTIMKAPTDT